MGVVNLRDRINGQRPHYDIYVGRRWQYLPASKYANPFTHKKYSPAHALDKFKDYFWRRPALWKHVKEDLGNNKLLGSWGGECDHVEWLNELANSSDDIELPDGYENLQLPEYSSDEEDPEQFLTNLKRKAKNSRKKPQTKKAKRSTADGDTREGECKDDGSKSGTVPTVLHVTVAQGDPGTTGGLLRNPKGEDIRVPSAAADPTQNEEDINRSGGESGSKGNTTKHNVKLRRQDATVGIEVPIAANAKESCE